MVLAASNVDEVVYFIVDPKDKDFDGVVISPEGTFLVPFWASVTRTPIKPFTKTDFHKDLWSDQRSEQWVEKYFSRKVDLTQSKEFKSISKMLKTVPKTLKGYS
jgi:hypothetical protein